MTHGIFTSAGNLVAWFDSRQDALDALADLIRDEPETAEEVAAIPFDACGRACGPAVTGDELLMDRA
jgi:hypothetical protein